MCILSDVYSERVIFNSYFKISAVPDDRSELVVRASGPSTEKAYFDSIFFYSNRYHLVIERRHVSTYEFLSIAWDITALLPGIPDTWLSAIPLIPEDWPVCCSRAVKEIVC